MDVLLNHWQRFVTPVEAGLLYSFGPVVAALAEVFAPAHLSRWAGLDYPNQPLTLTLITGGALVLAANVLIQAAGRRPQRPARSDGRCSRHRSPAPGPPG